MQLARVDSLALLGLNAIEVHIEVQIARGLPAFHLVGLPAALVRESRERVRAAITQSGFDFPQQRLTVNLAPADLPKDSNGLSCPSRLASWWQASNCLRRPSKALSFWVSYPSVANYSRFAQALP